MLAAADGAKTTREALVATVVDFCAERLRVLLRSASGATRWRRAWPRARTTRSTWPSASRRWRPSGRRPRRPTSGVAFKRVFNISREAPAGELTAGRPRAPHAARGGGAHRGLRAHPRGARAALGGARRYDDALELIARSLRAPVDRFFTEVFVMDKDEVVRASRLRLLGRIADSVAGFARFDALEGRARRPRRPRRPPSSTA
jgi:glycyl-tRNA synthetase beta chain